MAITAPKILAVGSAGNYAQLVVPELVRRGAYVRGLVRRPETAIIPRANGAADVVIGDMNDSESLNAAMQGMDGVFLIGPEFKTNEAEMCINVIESAKRAGVRKIAYSSVQHTFLDVMVNHYGKLPVHQALVESGLDFTILLPTTFMQSIELFQWDGVVKTGVYSHPISRAARQSWVDYRDVAESAAIALTTDKLSYGIFELAAGGMVSNEELVAIMSKSLGRTITVDDPPFDEYIKPFNIADPLIVKGYKAICDWYSVHGFPGGNNLSLRTILGRQPRGLQAYIDELAAKTG